MLVSWECYPPPVNVLALMAYPLTKTNMKPEEGQMKKRKQHLRVLHPFLRVSLICSEAVEFSKIRLGHE